MTKEEAKEHMRFLNGGFEKILKLLDNWGFETTRKLVASVSPVTGEDEVEKIIIALTIRKPTNKVLSIAYHIGTYIEYLVNDLFDKCFGNTEEDEYNEFGGYCATHNAVDFYWEITRAISLDNLFEL